MAVEPENGPREALARLERDMAKVKDALGLLGAKPCSVCGKFYLRSDPGNLFKACGDSVCYACFSSWWPDVSQNSLSMTDSQSSASSRVG